MKTQDLEVRVGNVYPAKGAARKRIAMWVVIAINETRMGGQSAHLIGLNDDGVITSTTSYGVHAMQGRDLIGRVEGLEDLEFNVEPAP